ncbi:hypothetical protein ACQP2P_16430 [Dactylosporangium sp. CA-139114]|uniref:hypothetical protein n=1 Tax=Dactylosporangium sp. CA-139114 TaxID=3239931 RepID=UPI003D96251D
MFTATPTVTLRDLPGLPVRATVLVPPLAAPVAERCMTALASRAIDAARRAHRDRAVFAVCVDCACCDAYSTAVKIAAAIAGIDVTVFVPVYRRKPLAMPSASDGAGRFGPDGELIDGTYADAVAASKRHASRTGAADVNVPGPYGNHGHLALAMFAVELLSGLPEPPAALWMPLDVLCPGFDGALRLMGWPTILTAVTAQPATGWPVNSDAVGSPRPAGHAPAQPPTAWPASPIEAYLGAPAGGRHVRSADAAQTRDAQRRLAAAGIVATTDAALGLAGLLATVDRADAHLAVAGDQVVLAAPSSTGPAAGQRR